MPQNCRIASPEELYVVAGVFNDGVRDYPAGTFIHNPAGSSHEAPIHLDAPLAAEFLAYSRDVDKNSSTWVKKQQGDLAWWAREPARFV